jgi:hypothetical protein
MLYKLRRQLFASRSTQIAVFTIALGFLTLWLADTQLTPNFPELAELLRGLAIAILTSGFVGFTFEYLTRISYAEMIKDIVANELEQLEDKLLGAPSQDNSLNAFWRVFTSEPTTIIIAQDQSGGESTVRSSDMVTAYTVYQGLVNLFSKSIREGDFSVQLDVVDKFSNIRGNSFPFPDKNLIVIGAPGANPVANYLMAYSKGIDPEKGEISDGYVFGVNEHNVDKYLPSPFVIPVPHGEEGIQDLTGGNANAIYKRRISKQVDAIDLDSCLLIYGKVNNLGEPITKENHYLIIAGHSRFSTQKGAEFVVANEEWAESVLQAKTDVETLINIRTVGIGGIPDIRLKHTPRKVVRHVAT